MLILKIDMSISYFHYTLLPYVGILVENVENDILVLLRLVEIEYVFILVKNMI